MRKTGRRRQETEEGGKDYHMKRSNSCGQHLAADKGKRGRERCQSISSQNFFRLNTYSRLRSTNQLLMICEELG